MITRKILTLLTLPFNDNEKKTCTLVGTNPKKYVILICIRVHTTLQIKEHDSPAMYLLLAYILYVTLFHESL